MNASELPLNVLIRAPELDGRVSGASMPRAWYEIISIHRLGSYQFSLEKTSIMRLPEPYSVPPCVKQTSAEADERNMFTGNYTMATCKETCTTKAELIYCSTASFMRRKYIKDKNFLKEHFRDQSAKEADKCLRVKQVDIEDYLAKCIDQCHNPCFEHTFKTQARYLRHEGDRLELSFHYEDLKETYIKEEPRYEVETLLSNFGGQLGLMAGMSALSIIEVLLWFVLLCVESLHRLIWPRHA